MKTLLKRFTGLLLLTVLAFQVMAAKPAPKVKTGVVFSESSIKLATGSVYTVDLNVNEFPLTEGGGLNVHFDPAFIQVTNVTVDGVVWDFVNQNGFINNVTGTAGNILFSSYAGVSGNARVASVEFTALKKGKTSMSLSESSLNPFASNGAQFSVPLGSVAISVSTPRGGR